MKTHLKHLLAVTALLAVAVSTACAAVAPASLQKLLANDGVSYDLFGFSVSLSADGRTVLIGAPGDDYCTGAAYVFVRTGSIWSEQAKLTADDKASFDQFGWSVSLSADGSTALIGAYGDNSYTGSAYLFTRAANNGWSQQQKLTADDKSAFDRFGWSVSLSGNTAAVGAYRKNNVNSIRSGAAYIFTCSGSTWTQQARLAAEDGTSEDWFGYSVFLSADGGNLLIGAYGDDDKGTNSGSAYVFTGSGSTWTQQAKLTADDGNADDYFAESLSLSADGRTALVGASCDDDKGSNSGSAYAFITSNGIWMQQAKLTAGDGKLNGYFGMSVSLSEDGRTALIGAGAYVFNRSGDTWMQQAPLPPDSSSSSDRFGYAVSLSASGSTALIGDYHGIGNETESGTACIFTGPADPNASFILPAVNLLLLHIR